MGLTSFNRLRRIKKQQELEKKAQVTKKEKKTVDDLQKEIDNIKIANTQQKKGK